jgi:hypothetical protein
MNNATSVRMPMLKEWYVDNNNSLQLVQP